MTTIRSFITSQTNRLTVAGVDSPRLSAEMLLAFVLGVERTELVKDMLVNPNRTIPDECLPHIEALTRRREQGEPAAYIVGIKEFFGRDFTVTPATLIPRPDTETLVEAALDFAQKYFITSGSFIDLGTGSGAIAITMALELPTWEGHAVDISPAALSVAQHNANNLGATNVMFTLYDFLSANLPGAPFDLIVANPPYVSEKEYQTLSREVRVFEPKSALVPDTANASGLEYLLSIMDNAAFFLKPGGKLFLEMGFNQGDALLAHSAASKTPWENACIFPDLAGLPRVFSVGLPIHF